LSINFERSLAIVGESGSGKSLTLKALLNLLPNNLDKDLSIKADFELIAGESISFVPQNPFTALSPLTKIKKQFFVSEKRIRELFNLVDLDLELLNRFPPELSGGQLQRVVIAMALEKDPKLILLDEPTTALDPKTKTNILQLIAKLQKEKNFKIIYVTHDILSTKELCEEILVIKGGKMVEYGKISQILSSPKEEYTKKLIEANFKNREFRK